MEWQLDVIIIGIIYIGWLIIKMISTVERQSHIIVAYLDKLSDSFLDYSRGVKIDISTIAEDVRIMSESQREKKQFIKNMGYYK